MKVIKGREEIKGKDDNDGEVNLLCERF